MGLVGLSIAKAGMFYIEFVSFTAGRNATLSGFGISLPAWNSTFLHDLILRSSGLFYVVL